MKQGAEKVERGKYEAEGSDRRAMGSVSLEGGGWWSAELSVSMSREDEIVLSLRRHGGTDRDDEGVGVELCLRPADLEALPVLLNGVIAQAREEGVLVRRSATG